MSDAAVFFLIGLLAALPIGIVTNLAAPRVDRWWGRRSATRAALNDARAAALHERAVFYVGHSDLLALLMIRRTMRIVFLGGLTTIGLGIAAVTLVAVQNDSADPVIPVALGRAVQFALALVIELIAIFTTVIISRTYFDARELHAHVAELRHEPAHDEI